MKNIFTLVKPFKTVQNSAKTWFSVVFFENRSKQCGIWIFSLFFRKPFNSTCSVWFCKHLLDFSLKIGSNIRSTYVQHTFNIRSTYVQRTFEPLFDQKHTSCDKTHKNTPNISTTSKWQQKTTKTHELNEKTYKNTKVVQKH